MQLLATIEQKITKYKLALGAGAVFVGTVAMASGAAAACPSNNSGNNYRSDYSSSYSASYSESYSSSYSNQMYRKPCDRQSNDSYRTWFKNNCDRSNCYKSNCQHNNYD